MHTESLNSLLDGITFDDYLPIDWEVLSELPSEGEQHRHHRASEELLQNLLLRDEASSQESEEVEVAGGGYESFKRLETRLDLLLNLLTEMMASNANLPAQHAVILGAHGLCVQTERDAVACLKKDVLLKIRIYLDPNFPRPLTLYTRLIDVQAKSFIVNFYPLEERLQDQLDKYVFRQHRRAIALARKNENS